MMPRRPWERESNRNKDTDRTKKPTPRKWAILKRPDVFFFFFTKKRKIIYIF